MVTWEALEGRLTPVMKLVLIYCMTKTQLLRTLKFTIVLIKNILNHNSHQHLSKGSSKYIDRTIVST